MVPDLVHKDPKKRETGLNIGFSCGVLISFTLGCVCVPWQNTWAGGSDAAGLLAATHAAVCWWGWEVMGENLL